MNEPGHPYTLIFLNLLCRSLVARGFALWLLLGLPSDVSAARLSEVADFGSNPGNLRMLKYIPDTASPEAPLVVALHGCFQTASDYDDETGWKQLADGQGFVLLLPEQKWWNNWSRCFNWFRPGDIQRDRGEALSIKQMIDKMHADHHIDPRQVYVTGLSAGGAMTIVMMATYPEVFAGGAPIAGLPYRCASGWLEAWWRCMKQGKDLSPAEWGRFVRAATRHKGPWPTISIWHGDADTTVIPVNATELLEQWLEVHGIDSRADFHATVAGHSYTAFKDQAGRTRIELYMVRGLEHGTPIDPGRGPEHCGRTGRFILDAQICSSRHIAKFWGLLP